MIDYRQFYAACMLTDPHMRLEWGTRYLYLVPAEVTRDKWEAYAEVCNAYKVPYRDAPVPPALRFYVTATYRFPDNHAYKGDPIFDNMPWTKETLGGGVGGKPGPDARPRLSLAFWRLQEDVENLRGYIELAALYDQGRTNRIAHINALANDPFVSKWR